MQGTWLMANPVKNPEIETQYLDAIKRYEPDEVRAVYPSLFSHVVHGLEDGPRDFLGQAFMELDLGSHWHGQFFTPYPLSKMMAECALQEVPERDVLTVSDPACGSGCMLIAASDVLTKKHIPSSRMHAVAVDVDSTCFHMAYIQLSLLGISAEVVLGNSLSQEIKKTWRTFASALTGHTMRSLQQKETASRVVDLPPREIRQATFEQFEINA